MVEATPMPTVKDLMEAHERFKDVMIDTLELATQFLRDRSADGVMDEDDEGLLRQCETVLEWACKLPGQASDSPPSGDEKHGA